MCWDKDAADVGWPKAESPIVDRRADSALPSGMSTFSRQRLPLFLKKSLKITQFFIDNDRELVYTGSHLGVQPGRKSHSFYCADSGRDQRFDRRALFLFNSFGFSLTLLLCYW